MTHPDTKNKPTNDLDELRSRIDQLESEKEKLESELKKREEMMSSLLSYIQSSSK